jgi:hypothetical protein
MQISLETCGRPGDVGDNSAVRTWHSAPVVSWRWRAGTRTMQSLYDGFYWFMSFQYLSIFGRAGLFLFPLAAILNGALMGAIAAALLYALYIIIKLGARYLFGLDLDVKCIGNDISTIVQHGASYVYRILSLAIPYALLSLGLIYFQDKTTRPKFLFILLTVVFVFVAIIRIRSTFYLTLRQDAAGWSSSSILIVYAALSMLSSSVMFSGDNGSLGMLHRWYGALYVFFPFFSAIFILAMWSKVTINFPRTVK